MSPRWQILRSITICTLPALFVGIIYETFLAHRHDYVGHYAAGYGGTLAATMTWGRMLGRSSYQKWAVAGLLPVCLACILLGAFSEATFFRIAKWDEVDFCNQSLGAVLASLASLNCFSSDRPLNVVFDAGLITGIAFLGVGACYAVA